MKTWMLAAVLAGSASLSFVAQAQTSQPVMTEVTTVETYKASSEGALGVAQWLRAQEAYVDGELGDIVVTRSRSRSGLYQAQSPGNDPPVGLPAFGSPGEEISIGSVRGAVTQSWTYRWNKRSRKLGSDRLQVVQHPSEVGNTPPAAQAPGRRWRIPELRGLS